MERGLLKALGGSCLLPIGVHTKFLESEGKASCHIFISDTKASKQISLEREFLFEKREEASKALLDELYEEGVNEILSSLGIEEFRP